jgi:hypothetical protein
MGEVAQRTGGFFLTDCCPALWALERGSRGRMAVLFWTLSRVELSDWTDRNAGRTSRLAVLAKDLNAMESSQSSNSDQESEKLTIGQAVRIAARHAKNAETARSWQKTLEVAESSDYNLVSHTWRSTNCFTRPGGPARSSSATQGRVKDGRSKVMPNAASLTGRHIVTSAWECPSSAGSVLC